MSIHQHATLEDTVYFWFGANDTSGSGDDGANAAADVRLAGAAAGAIPVLSPAPTLLTHANYPAGAYEVAVAATAGNGFAATNTYAVFCTLTADGQNPTGFVGSFTLDPIIANVKEVSDDSTAADNLELALENGTAGYVASDMKYLDGTAQSATDLKDFADAGYDPGTNKVQGVVLVDTTTTATTATNVTNVSAGGIAAASFAAGAIDASAIAANAIGASEIAADAIGASELAQAAVDQVWGTAARTLTASTNFNDISAAEVNTEVDNAIITYNLDHLAKTATAGADMTTEITDNTILSRILANGDTSAFDPSTDGLQPIRDRGDSAWTTAANDPTAATIADAVWNELSTGHTDAGKAGEQLWTDIDAILADTNELQTDDVPTLIAALPTAIENRQEMDSNSTQLSAIVTDTNELQTDDVPGLIGALNDISTAQVNTEVDTAFTTQMADSVSADGAIATREQALYMILQFLTEFGIAGTTITVDKVDGATQLMTFTLDDATNPTSLTRAT